MRWNIAVSVLLGLMVVSSVFASELKEVVTTSIGCDSKDTFSRAIDMMVDDDWVAVARLMVSGKCIKLEKGDTVFIEDFTITGYAKIRLKGETTVWWTDRKYLSE